MTPLKRTEWERNTKERLATCARCASNAFMSCHQEPCAWSSHTCTSTKCRTLDSARTAPAIKAAPPSMAIHSRALGDPCPFVLVLLPASKPAVTDATQPPIDAQGNSFPCWNNARTQV